MASGSSHGIKTEEAHSTELVHVGIEQQCHEKAIIIIYNSFLIFKMILCSEISGLRRVLASIYPWCYRSVRAVTPSVAIGGTSNRKFRLSQTLKS